MHGCYNNGSFSYSHIREINTSLIIGVLQNPIESVNQAPVTILESTSQYASSRNHALVGFL